MDLQHRLLGTRGRARRSLARGRGLGLRGIAPLLPLLLLAHAQASAQPAGERSSPGPSGFVRLTDPAAASGEDDESWELTARHVEYESDRQLFVAEGDVRIVRGDRHISADWMVFSNVTHRGVASGSVVMVDGIDTLLADFVAFDTRTLYGYLFDSLYDTPETGFRVEARELVKTGEKTYEVEQGRFTTCRCPADPDTERPPWRIDAAETDIEVGGYGVARNTSFEILGIPVLWFPWMIYPVKTERESGLLLPQIDLTGRNGFGIGVPIFWAARDNVNVTATPRWLSERGFKPSVDLEVVWGERSSADVYVSYIYDEKIQPDTAQTPFGRNRWGFEWQHDQYLPGDVRLRADVIQVSDNQYPIDFDDFPGLRIRRYLESTAFAFRDFERPRAGAAWSPIGQLGLYGAVDWGDDLQNPDDQDRDDLLLQRLPQIHLQGLNTRPRRTLGLVPSFDVDYTHFWSIEKPIDDRPTALVSARGTFLDTGIESLPDAQEKGGQAVGVADPNMDNFPPGPDMDFAFQEGEPPARRGHRVMVYPRVARPFDVVDGIQLYPEVGWQQTLYSTGAGFQERGLATALVELRSRWERELDLPLVPRVRHVLEPRLGWAWILNRAQAGNPLFVPPTALPQERLRELDLFNVTRDTADRIGPYNGVTFGFTNRFFARGPLEAFPSLRMELTLLGQYRFDQRRFGLVVVDGRTLPSSGFSSKFSFAIDPRTARVNEGLFSAGWTLPLNIQLGTRYRYRRNIPAFFEDFATNQERFADDFTNLQHVNQLTGYLRVPIGTSWAVTYGVAYSFDQSLLLANRGGIEYFSRCRCWAARLELSDDRQRGVDFRFEIELVGLGRNSPSFGTWESAPRRSLLDSRAGL